MQRFYFDIADGVNLFDLEGRLVDSNRAALRNEAIQSARDMMAEATRDGRDISKRRFEIKDQERLPVMTVEFAEALSAEPNRDETPDTSFLLTAREREVLIWTAQGTTSEDISLLLAVSPRTVEHHIISVMRKLNVVNRQQAVSEALKRGEI